VENERNILLVFTNPVPGREAEFHRWYEEDHMPYVLETPGILSAQRFVLPTSRRPSRAPAGSGHRHLVVYELERDGNEVQRDLMARRAGPVKPLSDAYDVASTMLDSWVSASALRLAR
jgi:hypothetical protein